VTHLPVYYSHRGYGSRPTSILRFSPAGDMPCILSLNDVIVDAWL